MKECLSFKSIDLKRKKPFFLCSKKILKSKLRFLFKSAPEKGKWPAELKRGVTEEFGFGSSADCCWLIAGVEKDARKVIQTSWRLLIWVRATRIVDLLLAIDAFQCINSISEVKVHLAKFEFNPILASSIKRESGMLTTSQYGLAFLFMNMSGFVCYLKIK